MIKLNITDTPEAIIKLVGVTHENIDEVLHKSSHDIPNRSHAIEPYQAAVLYLLAAQYNKPRVQLLEIGTRFGYSASILAQACPKAKITTVDAEESSRSAARENLKAYKNVTCVKSKSWNWLEQVEDDSLSFIFVDGDHEEVARDLAWWAKLKSGGLMLFHDYTPSRFPRVVTAVHQLTTTPDVVVIQIESDKGMAGVYKP